ncbi:MAG: Short-chain-fatty-acid--CoA ligase [Nocardia sp.]|uniref:AMP-binding protein n=1 Tax=Nocardia sp. TaxID=1821 RepID=UPI0026280AA5|nr:AMP-binding protein [Nocardia sp.]MCU1643044.1 Short-chain-fatty-acid--CoA ligase [Nocardia sp.]
MTIASVTDRFSEEDIRHFYATGQWHRENLFDILEAQAAAQPDHVFLTDDTSSLTFRELRDRAVGLAVGLRRHGIGPGDRVSAQIPNWTEFATISAALSRLGAILVPIMPIYRRDEVRYVLDTADVRIAICPNSFKKFEYLEMYRGLRDELPGLAEIVVLRSTDVPTDVIRFESLVAEIEPAAAHAELGPAAGPDEPFLIVYTSGTTSRPKGCVHTFNTYACAARLLAKAFAYTAQDVQFGPSPITHTTGLVTSVILPLIHGAASHLMEAWDPKRGMDQIRKHGCTAVVCATTFLQMLMDTYDSETDDISSMRIWVAAGSPIPGNVVERATKLLPTMRVLSLYGRSENLSTTVCAVDDDPARSVTSDGRALPLQSVRIVDQAGNEVPRGEEGDIAYKGAMHMLEYLDQPEETAALFTANGYSRSGDLGQMDADGFIRVTGRTKDIVIRGGLNISVREIEDLLTAHPGVRAVAVVGMPDLKLGEAVCCYLVPLDPVHPLTLVEIKKYLLDAGLAVQKVPQRLEIANELPMTATGKIQKHILRTQIAEQLGAGEHESGGAHR